MNYLKKLGLAALAVTALMAVTGSASATTLTSPAGTTLAVGAKVKATALPLKTEGPLAVHCETSVFEGQVEKAGGASETVRIPLSSLTFNQCGGFDTFSVLKRGSLEIHTDTASADGNGTVTWDGAELTILAHRTVLGFPITMHCISYTEGTHFGKLTGSSSKGGKTATLDVAARLPLKATSPGCEEGFTWTASFVFETPDYLDVD